MTLEALNSLPATDARVALERCCGASRWIEAMLAVRPFGTAAALFAASDRAFAPLERADWLQAFAHHPKIGDVSALRAKFAGTAAWAGAEQGGAAGATDATLRALAEGNRAYEERFGYIFIVCATGKTAGDMLTLLNARLDNAADAELSLAAAEQRKITRLRIEKLLGETA